MRMLSQWKNSGCDSKVQSREDRSKSNNIVVTPRGKSALTGKLLLDSETGLQALRTLCLLLLLLLLMLLLFMSPLRRHIFVCFMAKSAFWRGFSALAPYTGVGPI